MGQADSNTSSTTIHGTGAPRVFTPEQQAYTSSTSSEQINNYLRVIRKCKDTSNCAVQQPDYGP